MHVNLAQLVRKRPLILILPNVKSVEDVPVAYPYNAIAHLKRPCKFSCPVNAITYNEYGISVIDKEKCIRCGKCIHSCPFGAIASKTFIVPVIEALKAGKHIYAMAAPATEGQFGVDITMASWKKAMKEMGFTDFYDVGLGGDMTAAYEAEEWAEAYKEGNKKVTSLSGIRKYGAFTLSGISRVRVHNSVSDVCSFTSDQSKRSGSNHCIYRTLCCQEV